MRDAVMLWLGLLGGCGACATLPEEPSELSTDASVVGGGCMQTACDVFDPLPARTWRLSHEQYARAVRQFLGVEPDASGFEPELDNGVFPNMSSSGLVGGVLAHDYYESAEKIVSQLPSATLVQLTGGAPLTPASRAVFLQAAIRGAFRRAPTPDDLQAYGELFDAEPEAEPDGSSPFRAVLRALLSSPYFLYRTELGSDPGSVRFSLTGYELASLLSFSLQDGPPSETLLAAAESGALAEPAALKSAIEMLLETPEASAQLGRFLEQWLEIHRFDQLTKDLGLFPDFAQHKADMWAEAKRFLEQTGGLSGSVPALLTTPVVPSREAAAYYASDPSALGSAGTRTGVLSLAAVIAAHSRLNGTSPTLRGLFVRERMLCQSVHLPPGGAPNIVDTLLLKQPLTTRDLYAQHALDPACAACHVLLDSIGFNFEDFDATGRYRTLENGVPIDTSGELVEPQVGGPTRDHTELAQRLARSDAVRRCFARQVFRFYLGLVEPQRELPARSALPALESVYQAATHGSLRDVVSVLLQTQASRPRERQPW